MKKDELLDLIDRFKSGLISQSTDGTINQEEYREYRDILINEPKLKSKVPQMIKSNFTPSDFRNYMQGKYAHYSERRSEITQVMNELMLFVEENFDSIDDLIPGLNSINLGEKIGSGGFGEVYKYHNTLLNMDFAVKIYSPVFTNDKEKVDGERRFFREAKILLKLNNKNIVRIFDAGYMDEKPFIKMEYIDGYDLYEFHKKSDCLSFSDTIIIVKQILNGLNCAHENGVIHRDLKPSNIMYSKDNNVYKIIDFGISAFINNESHTKLTKTGEHISGGLYIDPLLEENPMLRDVRSDIYSVGANWYYLLCGRAPSGSDMKGYLKKVTSEINDFECDIVIKCLASNIDDRYRNCEELIREIERIKY